MIVTSAQYTDSDNNIIEATIDGETWYVPVENNNSHYKAILAWVDDGNTIQDAE